MQKISAIYSIGMGVALLSTWAVLFLSGKVPEIATQPIQTLFLVVAEILTGLSLIASGFGILAGLNWSLSANLVALGMLLYCSINYLGVLGQQPNVPAAIFMALVAVGAFFFSIGMLRLSITNPPLMNRGG